MHFETEDPKLTQYALGELNDPAEVQAIEAYLADSEESRRYVEQVRATAKLLSEAFAAEPQPGLTDEQHQAIETEIAGTGDTAVVNGNESVAHEATADSRPRADRRKTHWLAYATAAGLLLATGMLSLQMFDKQRVDRPQETQLARAMPDDSQVGKRLYDVALNRDEADKELPLKEERMLAARAEFQAGASAAETESAPTSGGKSYAYRQPAAKDPAGADSQNSVAVRERSREMSRLSSATQSQPAQPRSGGRSTSQGLEYKRRAVANQPASESMTRFAGRSGQAARPDPNAGPKPDAAEGGASDSLAKTFMAGEIAEQTPKPVDEAKNPTPVDDLAAATVAGQQQDRRGGARGTMPAPTDEIRDQLAEKQQKKRVRQLAVVPQTEAEVVRPPGESVANRPKQVELVRADRDKAELVGRELRQKLSEPAAPKSAEGEERSKRKKLDSLNQNRSNTENYSRIVDNPFLSAQENALSTFSIDVDTASYSNVRRFLTHQSLPPADAVRIEEMINYFTYEYEPPSADRPFSVNLELADCPWEPKHRLVRIGLKGRMIDHSKRPASNLIFLIDVSGSMRPEKKLPLLKRSMTLLVNELTENDSVAIVVYASATGLVLPATSGDQKSVILGALDRLQAGGSTNGGAGIQLAYDTAVDNFIRGGSNRVILATDGDFNVGISSEGDLTRLIEAKARSGVFLSVLGFGTGNLKDSKMEKLADKGNGNFSYIDSIKEGRKVLVEQMSGTLVTIAKDVKIQVDFNYTKVDRYRLIGYANRLLRAEDFKDDTKDAGEIGAGHTVTALFEIVPKGKSLELAQAEKSRYQRNVKPTAAAKKSGELLAVKLRYKEPDEETSKLIEEPLQDEPLPYAKASDDFKFAAAVASFGMLLRDSPYKGNATYGSVIEHAEEGKGADEKGYRAEFVELVKKAQQLAK